MDAQVDSSFEGNFGESIGDLRMNYTYECLERIGKLQQYYDDTIDDKSLKVCDDEAVKQIEKNTT